MTMTLYTADEIAALPVTCRLFRHDHQPVEPTIFAPRPGRYPFNMDFVVKVCSRCGDTVTRIVVLR